MEAKLIVVAGEAKEGEYKLRLPTVVGRSRTTDLTLGHPLVSRQHCELYEADGVLMVRDLGSLNGTFVGETRITGEVSLEPGSLLTIGAVTFKAEYGAGRPAAKKPAKAAAAAAAAHANDEIQQTLQADGLASLEELRESHAAPEPAVAEHAEQDLELDWLEEADEAAEEVAELEEFEPAEDEVAELEELEVEESELEKSPVADDEFELHDLEEIPAAEDVETQPVEKTPATAKVTQSGEAQGKPGQEADDGLDDFFKTLE